MTSNGRHDPIVDLFATAVPDGAAGEGGDEYEAMMEMDRLEELLEAMGELGAKTRADVESLAPSPAQVEVAAEMDALRMTSRTDIEVRLAELEALLADE